MTKEKVHREVAEKKGKSTAPPARQKKAATPENQAGPLPTQAPAPETDTAGRARTMTEMQQTVGNVRVGRLLEQTVQTKLADNKMTEQQKQVPDQIAKSDQPIQRQPEESQAESPTKAAGEMPAYITDALKQKTAATILAESYPGQEEKIRWIYLTRIRTAKGVEGLGGSAAYARKSRWYKIWLYMAGDHSYGKDALPSKTEEFKDFSTIKDFCEKNAYMQNVATKRATNVTVLVDDMFKTPSANPYSGWIGQGNLDDINNLSQPDSLYWKRARAYYWLQVSGKVKQTYVEVLPAGRKTQFIFDAKSIQAYFDKHPLPKAVPLYEP